MDIEVKVVIYRPPRRNAWNAYFVPWIRPRNYQPLKGPKRVIAVNFDDVSEAFLPIALVDKDGEPIDAPAGTVVNATSDNTEVAVPSQSPDAFGLVIKSVGDAAPNTGTANITGCSVDLPDGSHFDLEDVEVNVGVSGAGGASFDPSNVVVRPRT